VDCQPSHGFSSRTSRIRHRVQCTTVSGSPVIFVNPLSPGLARLDLNPLITMTGSPHWPHRTFSPSQIQPMLRKVRRLAILAAVGVLAGCGQASASTGQACRDAVVQVVDANTAHQRPPVAAAARACRTVAALNAAMRSLDPYNLTPSQLARYDQWWLAQGFH